MKHSVISGKKVFFISAIATLFFSANVQATDAEAAKALAKQNNCFTCHAIDKEKVGPAWNKVAAKYKDDAQAQEKLTYHLTTGGNSKTHLIIKADDPNEIKNLVDWILAL